MSGYISRALIEKEEVNSFIIITDGKTVLRKKTISVNGLEQGKELTEKKEDENSIVITDQKSLKKTLLWMEPEEEKELIERKDLDFLVEQQWQKRKAPYQTKPQDSFAGSNYSSGQQFYNHQMIHEVGDKNRTLISVNIAFLLTQLKQISNTNSKILTQ